MKTLSGKVVVITGAGSGIGRALALEAGRRGAVLALSDWEETGLTETARLAAGLPGTPKTLVLKVDVQDDAAVTAFAKQVDDSLGGAHVVINNAGVSLSDTVGSMKRADFERLFQINFWGVVRGTEAFLPQLLKKDDAHVVNISSVFGLVGMPSQSAYCAAKFAVRGYTESLRQELFGSPVNVSCVHPGGVRTNIVRSGIVNRGSRGEPADLTEVAATFDKIAKLSPEQAAAIIWRGVLRNDPRILVGTDAWFLDRMQRLLPRGYPTLSRFGRWLMDRQGVHV